MSASAPQSTPKGEPRPFTFDTVFDGARVIAPVRPRTAFTAEELAAARAEGEAQGRASATAQAEAAQAAALDRLAQAATAALDALARVAHEHRAASAELALACARAVAGAALERFPEAAAAAAFQALAREVEAQPRLVVTTAAGDLERTRAAVEALAARSGHAGRIVVTADPGLAPAAFSFDWGDGRCAFDPAAAAARVEGALREALAVEGLHAEPPPLAPPATPSRADP
jgi:flagellar assembly protein FliH